VTLVEELETTIQQVAERVGPAVVGLGRGWGGSGVVIGPGRVLTNAHNLRHDEVGVTFSDGRRVTGRVAASDGDLDVAVIDVDTGEIEPIEWVGAEAGSATVSDTDVDGETVTGNGSEPSIGRAVFALANPAGRGLRVTPGFVSSTARSFRGPRGRRVAGAIEHTAPLPRGSSGGPLVDSAGRLLGINSIRVDGGLILALPADAALHDRVEALGRGEAPKRIRLGVAIAPPRVARRLRRAVGLPERDGVLVRAVEDDSAADRAGIERGDLIVAVAGRELERVDVLYEALDAARADGSIELTIVRGTEERTVPVTF
jgi:serine protease Do